MMDDKNKDNEDRKNDEDQSIDSATRRSIEEALQ